uniref:Uncharacterized protein n=1 Tax=Arundo donax TaxID=35708 RepID=A0A0A9CJT7_ARUDO
MRRMGRTSSDCMSSFAVWAFAITQISLPARRRTCSAPIEQAM